MTEIPSMSYIPVYRSAVSYNAEAHRHGNIGTKRFPDLCNKRRRHCAYQRAVVETNGHLTSRTKSKPSGVHNQMITAGAKDRHARSQLQSGWIRVLMSDGENRLRYAFAVV